jgi:hypothetical protein
MVPAWIHERFKTAPWGEVSEEAQISVYPEIMGVITKHEDAAAIREEIPGVDAQHAADREIRSRGLNFGAGKAMGSARQRLRAIQEEDAPPF